MNGSSRKASRVIRPDTAYIIDDILSDSRASYMSQKPHNYHGWKFGFKTGTTNDAKDGLMMGMSTKYAAGVWVGYHDRTRAMSGFMETMTRPIVSGWMNAAHKDLPPKNWEKPASVKTEAAFVQRSHVGSSSQEPGPSTDLYPSWYKPKVGTSASAVLDKVSNKLATDCTPELAKETVNNASTDKFSIDTFVTGGASSNTTSTDDVHNCSDVKPTIAITIPGSACTANAVCPININVTQGTHMLNDPNRVGAGGGIVTLYINGNKVQEQPASSNIAFSYVPPAAGSYSVSASVVDSVLYSADVQASTPLVVQ